MGKIKILELCHFSEGICGVWNRVKEESSRLSDLGYEVRVFSSNAIKGSKGKAKSSETINKVRVKRFPYVKLGGESFMYWDFIKEALEYAPDIIIAHVYRHPHTTSALKIRKILEKKGKNCTVLLVTHAPFNNDNSESGIIAKTAVKLYDFFIGRKTINKFDKVINISNWEIPYLLKLGLKRSKLFYLPNGVPEAFFKSSPPHNENNKILFLGRISPVKNLSLVILSLSKTKNYSLDITGPSEGNYKKELESLVKSEWLNKRVSFSDPVYDLTKKIKKIDSAMLFILPSKREGMPQSLIEAMARGRVCIG
ncbi:MAG: glycosyltransferase family 4 protein, partial [Nanoarchaeota archaeon]